MQLRTFRVAATPTGDDLNDLRMTQALTRTGQSKHRCAHSVIHLSQIPTKPVTMYCDLLGHSKLTEDISTKVNEHTTMHYLLECRLAPGHMNMFMINVLTVGQHG